MTLHALEFEAGSGLGHVSDDARVSGQCYSILRYFTLLAASSHADTLRTRFYSGNVLTSHGCPSKFA